MNLKRILILVTLELVCPVLTLSQYPATQSSGANQSEASTDQNQGAPAQPGTQTSNDQNQGAPTQPPPGPALSGAEVFAPVLGSGQSYIIPGVQFSTYANSNPASTSGSSSVDGQAVLVGTLGLQRVRTSSQLNLTYQGGVFSYFGPSFTSNGGAASDWGSFQSLNVMETVNWRHWRLQFGDQLSYLPESAFGFVGFAGLNTVGLVPGGGVAGNPVLNSTLNPNQTILTGNARRLSNMAITQVEYGHGRSTITATAVYGTLHFLDPGFIDSNSLTVFAGYNYSLTRRDIVAITAIYSDFRYNGGLPGVTLGGFHISYGRKLARRLYLQLGGGPIASKSAPVGFGNVTTTTWSTFNSLQYLVPRGSLGLIYSRFPTTGSGVLIGAENDYVSFVASRRLSHVLYGSLNLGYAYNRSLEQSTGANQQFTFNTWQAGATLSRSFGERLNANFYGNVLRQLSGGSGCFESLCEGDVFRYVIGLGLNWHGRPLRLR